MRQVSRLSGVFARRAGLLLLLAALALPLALAGAAPGRAADQTQNWDWNNVTIRINPDSTMDVTERQVSPSTSARSTAAIATSPRAG